MITSRRELLKILGSAAVAAPVIPALAGRASGATSPRRLLLLFSSSGTIAESYWPTGGERDFAFAPGSILEPLAPHRNDILVFNNLVRNWAGSGGNHERGVAGLWTGAPVMGGFGPATGPSIDQVIANALPLETDFRTLEAGVQVNLGYNVAMSYMISKGANQPIPPENSPAKLYDRLFGSIATAGGVSTDRLRARRQSTLDFIGAELAAIQQKVSADDRQKIDAHLQAVRSIEKRLQKAPAGACGTRPDGSVDEMANDNFPMITKLQMDLLVSAFACDRVRIASLQCSRGFSGTRFTWLNVGLGHHAASHDLTMKPQLARINRWYMQQLAYLIGEMKKIPEGNGTMLDNTLIVYANELNEGSAHIPSPIPMVMAGRLGGSVRPGRYIDYGKGAPYTHNGMLVTICRAMGATQVNQVGLKD